MKKKNVFRTAALLAVASVSFAGCSEDDDVKGGDSSDGGGDSSFAGVVKETVQDPPDNEKIDAVKLMIEYPGNMYVAATGTYQNGSFELTLPTTVSDDYLSEIADDIADDIPSGGITVSNPNAKARQAEFFPYKGESGVRGEFVYGSADGNTSTDFMYVNSDVNITGSAIDKGGVNVTYKVSLKKGWNKMYKIRGGSEASETYNVEYTTTEPSGLKWYFESNN